MFPIGTRVQVIIHSQDFSFFGGDETGTVIQNKGDYLSIIVEFDKPLEYRTGGSMKSFNFMPDDLIILEKANPEKNRLIEMCDEYNLLKNDLVSKKSEIIMLAQMLGLDGHIVKQMEWQQP